MYSEDIVGVSEYSRHLNRLNRVAPMAGVGSVFRGLKTRGPAAKRFAARVRQPRFPRAVARPANTPVAPEARTPKHAPIGRRGCRYQESSDARVPSRDRLVTRAIVKRGPKPAERRTQRATAKAKAAIEKNCPRERLPRGLPHPRDAILPPIGHRVKGNAASGHEALRIPHRLIRATRRPGQGGHRGCVRRR